MSSLIHSRAFHDGSVHVSCAYTLYSSWFIHSCVRVFLPLEGLSLRLCSRFCPIWAVRTFAWWSRARWLRGHSSGQFVQGRAGRRTALMYGLIWVHAFMSVRSLWLTTSVNDCMPLSVALSLSVCFCQFFFY